MHPSEWEETGARADAQARSRHSGRMGAESRVTGGGLVLLHDYDDVAEDAIVSPYAGEDLEPQVQKGGAVRITTRAGWLEIPWVVRIEVP